MLSKSLMRTGLLSTQVAPRAWLLLVKIQHQAVIGLRCQQRAGAAHAAGLMKIHHAKITGDHDDGAPQHKLRLNQQDPGQQRGHSSPSFPARVSFAKRRSASRMDSSTGPKVRGTVSITQSVPMWCPLGALSGAPA